MRHRGTPEPGMFRFGRRLQRIQVIQIPRNGYGLQLHRVIRNRFSDGDDCPGTTRRGRYAQPEPPKQPGFATFSRGNSRCDAVGHSGWKPRSRPRRIGQPFASSQSFAFTAIQPISFAGGITCSKPCGYKPGCIPQSVSTSGVALSVSIPRRLVTDARSGKLGVLPENRYIRPNRPVHRRLQ